MSDLVPSYFLKGNRAEKHLHELKVEIAKWANTHPYEVVTRLENKREVSRLNFTTYPPAEIGIICADIVHNLRSGLDHLMGALVTSAKRSKVYFPIYFDGVWGPPDKEDDESRTKARGRWRSDTEKVHPSAIAILQSLQPDEGARDDDDPEINAFLFLNRLSTKDRHQKLPVVFSALRGIRLIYKDAQGVQQIIPGTIKDGDIAQNGTPLVYPPGAMDMTVAGAPVVAIALADPKADVVIPEAFDRALWVYRERAVKPLSLYVRV